MNSFLHIILARLIRSHALSDLFQHSSLVHASRITSRASRYRNVGELDKLIASVLRDGEFDENSEKTFGSAHAQAAGLMKLQLVRVS